MTTATSSYRLIPLAEIQESPHNPRRHFDGPALAQLADSIKKVGVLMPALVRPNAQGDRFELAAGHRRYRAAKLAGIDALPCLVREMTDQAFMEVLTIENLQREDVHPLDEATGYQALMAKPYKMDVQRIADRVGKSTKYIYDRVKLLDLSKPAQALFWDGLIEAGHAILLARLTPVEQAKVIGTKPNDYTDGGLFQHEHRLYDSEDAEDADRTPHIKARSVREVEAFIKQHIRFNAKQADAFLFPETVKQVSAAAETKRKIIEITHEYLADEDVRHASEARVYGERAWKRADGKEGSKPCERSVLGVIASGPGQGQAFDVCVNKDKCTVHWGVEIKAREKRQKSGGKTASGGTAKEDSYQAKWRAEQERERKRREQWDAAVPAMREALAARIKNAPVKVGSAMVKALIDDVRQYRQPASIGQMVPPGKTAEGLLRHLGWLHVSKRLEYGPGQGDRVMTAFGLDPKKFLPKDAPDKAAQTSAKGKRKKAA